ncbi:MAG: hypothetical protein WC869_05160 [Phycisphaerae bacterium]|jgi:hypothetical protein
MNTCNIYHGLGGVGGVDWQTPLARNCPTDSPMQFGLPMGDGAVHCLVARAVDANGCEQAEPWAIGHFQLDNQGRVAPVFAPLLGLAWRVLSGGFVRLSFVCRGQTGRPAPTHFDILSDRGVGVLDEHQPLATLNASPTGRYSVTVASSVLPAQFAVRPRSGLQAGVPCRSIRLDAMVAHPPVTVS